jgi:hypothetical protein
VTPALGTRAKQGNTTPPRLSGTRSSTSPATPGTRGARPLEHPRQAGIAASVLEGWTPTIPDTANGVSRRLGWPFACDSPTAWKTSSVPGPSRWTMPTGPDRCATRVPGRRPTAACPSYGKGPYSVSTQMGSGLPGEGPSFRAVSQVALRAGWRGAAASGRRSALSRGERGSGLGGIGEGRVAGRLISRGRAGRLSCAPCMGGPARTGGKLGCAVVRHSELGRHRPRLCLPRLYACSSKGCWDCSIR